MASITYTDGVLKAFQEDDDGLGRHFVHTPAWYDIRDYGAIPGPAGQTATTAAFNAIFAEISWSYFPDVDGKRSAVIYVPATYDTAWYTGDLDPYVGSAGANILMRGDTRSGRSGIEGSTLIFNGTPGGDWFDFQAINASKFENLTFDGNSKAKRLIRLRQYWNVAHMSQVATSDVHFDSCFFHSPYGDYDSACVEIGDDVNPPNTYQCDTVRFDYCYFQGHNTIQGWGVRAVVGGNTKNFAFTECDFAYFYRGIETLSGSLLCTNVTGANIGYDRDANAALITVAAQSFTWTGGALESGTLGYFAKLLNITGQNTPSHITGVYAAGTAPADDYMVGTSGKTTIDACEFQNGRATTNAIAWTALTPITLGQQRLNDTNKWYTCITAGTTGNAGGPTGTGSDITDGSVHWKWSATGDANNAKISAGSTEYPTAHGSLILECCDFAYNATLITAVPIYDGSDNPLGVGIGGVYDYARSVPHMIYCRGNRTGLFGADIDKALPDFEGVNVINARDQFWTNYIASGCTVTRNDTGVYIITVPAAVVAAAGATPIRIGDMYAGMRLSDAIIDVTTLFSGPGVTGIEVSLGNSEVAVDDILLSASVETVGQIGLVAADRGTSWEADRYIIPFDAATPELHLTCTVSGGTQGAINAGSLNVYLQFQRLKV